MAWGYRRRDPNTDYGPASNSYEAADYLHAMNAYGAAVRDLEPEDRPPLDPTEWAGGGHAAWACDDPVGCPAHGSGRSTWEGIDVPDPWQPPPQTGLAGHRSGHCLTWDPNCAGECGG